MEKLMGDTDSSIFSPGPSIDPSIKEKLGALNPITLKKVLRAYIGASIILSTTSGKQPGVVEKENFIKEKINQKGINGEYLKTKTLSELTSVLYASSKVESSNLSPEVINKIKSYKLVLAGKELPNDNLDISVDPEICDDNSYEVTLTIKKPEKINEKISSVKPIMVYFDKTGNILTDTVQMKTNIPAVM